MPYPYNNYGYPAAYQQMQNTQQLMIRVSGEAEAWNYPMAPGSAMQFTDGARIYIKTMDNSPTGSFRFERFVREEPQKPESPDYEVEVHANIEVPTGGTVEEIRLAIAVDGVVDPASVMQYTPAAVEVAGNVGTSIIVSVPSICGCDNVAVVNASEQPITVNNASLVFDYAGVKRIA